jgi:outer membrane protein
LTGERGRRGRVLVVAPQEDTSLNFGGVRVPGADVNISTPAMPELVITYFFTPKLALELILGVTPHNAKGAARSRGPAPVRRGCRRRR